MVKNELMVRLTIGAETAMVGDVEVPLTAPAEISEGSTFVPLRFLAEALGALVEYDEETGAITVITSPEDEATGDETTDDEATDDETTGE